MTNKTRKRKFYIHKYQRIYLPALNKSKGQKIESFLKSIRSVKQYFVDLLWQQNNTLKMYVPGNLIRYGVKRFGLSYRLSAVLANDALGVVKSARKNKRAKPNIKRHVVTLSCHFAKLEKSNEISFDFVLQLKGCEVPKLSMPFFKTKHLNNLFSTGWQIAKSFRIGIDNKNKLYIDLTLEKTKPEKVKEGKVFGMDSNYKGGFVFSDGRTLGKESYDKIVKFAKREKNTYKQIKENINKELKRLDLNGIRLIAVEDLKNIKQNKRGTFSRTFNRRLSHWTYSYFITRLEQKCEEQGITVSKKLPFYTSQTCNSCHRCDRRNRVRNEFACVWCGHRDDADLNAARNLCLLGEAELYGIRSLKSWKHSDTLKVLNFQQPLYSPLQKLEATTNSSTRMASLQLPFTTGELSRTRTEQGAA